MSSGTVYGAVLDYLDHLRESGYKEHTVLVYGRELAKMHGYYGAYRKVKSITRRMVEGFFVSDPCLKGKANQHLSRHTTERTKRVFRHFLLWAHETGRLENLPLTELEQRKAMPGYRFGALKAVQGET